MFLWFGLRLMHSTMDIYFQQVISNNDRIIDRTFFGFLQSTYSISLKYPDLFSELMINDRAKKTFQNVSCNTPPRI